MRYSDIAIRERYPSLFQISNVTFLTNQLTNQSTNATHHLTLLKKCEDFNSFRVHLKSCRSVGCSYTICAKDMLDLRGCLQLAESLPPDRSAVLGGQRHSILNIATSANNSYIHLRSHRRATHQPGAAQRGTARGTKHLNCIVASGRFH